MNYEIVGVNTTICVDTLHEKRERVDTEKELMIVQDLSDKYRYPMYTGKCRKHIEYFSRLCAYIYSIIQSTYKWNVFIFSVFLTIRIMFIKVFAVDIHIQEWYNDIPIFLMANHYLYKRIHWNSKKELFFMEENTNNRSSISKGYIILIFIMSIIIYSLLHDTFRTFYISYSKLSNMDNIELFIFISICSYFICNQIYSIYYTYPSRIQFYKYMAIILYIFSGQLIYNMYTTKNEYHIHHWIIGILLMFLTEFRQPFHTYLQYIHYAIYIHGIAVYGYDTLTT